MAAGSALRLVQVQRGRGEGPPQRLPLTLAARRLPLAQLQQLHWALAAWCRSRQTAESRWARRLQLLQQQGLLAGGPPHLRQPTA